jgi:hypothetical protein
MKLLRKCSSLLLLMLFTAYGGVALTATTLPLLGRLDNANLAQVQPDTPVDCRKTPNHPRCKPIGLAGSSFFTSADAASGLLRESALS